MSVLTLKIPATSANLGLGFDSMGIAVDKFLTIKAEESTAWAFHYADKSLEELPNGEENLVAHTAIQVAKEYGKEIPALSVDMDSEIPLTHGLGSSSSAIVAGIELADYYCGLNLSEYDKILIGSKIEGHPDNIGPCVTGGVFVGYYNDGELNYYTSNLDGVSLIVSIPQYEINTNEARAALPEDYSREHSVEQNAKNNVMLLSLWNNDYQLMGDLMMQDRFHEPYRRPLIKEFDIIKERAVRAGAYATIISGAGPTLLTLCPNEKSDQIFNELTTVDSCIHEKLNIYYK